MAVVSSLTGLKRRCLVGTATNRRFCSSVIDFITAFDAMARWNYVKVTAVVTVLSFMTAGSVCHAGLPSGTANSMPKPKRILPQTKPITVTGEVVDVWCYCSQVMGSGRGEQHKACALACAHGGVTLAIVADKTGEVYVAAKHRGYQGCKELLLPFVAKHVKVVGWLAQKGGCNVLKIKNVELVK